MAVAEIIAVLLLLAAPAAGRGPRATLEFPRDGEQVFLASTMADMQVRLHDTAGWQPGRDFEVEFWEPRTQHEPLFYSDNGRYGLLDPPVGDRVVRGEGGVGHTLRLGHLAVGEYEVAVRTVAAGTREPLQAEPSRARFSVVATAAAPGTDARVRVEPPTGSRVVCSRGAFAVLVVVDRAPGPDTQVCLEHRVEATEYHSMAPNCHRMQPPRPDEQAASSGVLSFNVGQCAPGLVHTFGIVVMHAGRAVTPTQVVTYVEHPEPSQMLHDHVLPFIKMGGSWGKRRLSEALTAAVQRFEAPTVCETGFNAGFSSQLFLAANQQARVIAFDVCEHTVVSVAKEWMDRHYPGRHTLVPGDSTASIEEFRLGVGAGERCDVVFVDGGHELPIALSDLLQLRRMSHAGTVLIADDTLVCGPDDPCHEVLEGPARAWASMEARGMVATERRVQERYEGKEDSHTVGRYIF